MMTSFLNDFDVLVTEHEEDKTVELDSKAPIISAAARSSLAYQALQAQRVR